MTVKIGVSSDCLVESKFYKADFRSLPGNNEINAKGFDDLFHDFAFMAGTQFTHEPADVFFCFRPERSGGHLNSRSKLISLPFHYFRCFLCNSGGRSADHLAADAGGAVVIQLFEFKDLPMLYPVNAFVDNRMRQQYRKTHG